MDAPGLTGAVWSAVIDVHATAAPQVLLLGCLFAALAFVSDSVWVLVASRAPRAVRAQAEASRPG